MGRDRRAERPCPSPSSTPSGGSPRSTTGRCRPRRRSRSSSSGSAPSCRTDRRTPAGSIDHLATALEPGLTAMPSGRFYGMVIGGTHPAALAADWLVSAWDQNAGLARLTPAATATEQVASAWLLDLLGLPEGSAVGFVTGGTMANFTCLAAGRDAVLRQAGWDVGTQGTGRQPGRAGAGRRRSGTTPSTWRCATSASVRRSRWPPTTRAGWSWRDLERALAERDGRRWSASRPATCTPAATTRSPRRSRWRTGTAPGCTSTARSGSSPPPRRRTATSPRASPAPTRGPPTRTRPSTCPTTAGSRSSATRPR